MRRIPADDAGHHAALDRTLVSLAGLSVGDAFGETFFATDAEDAIAARRLPPAPWAITDDTVMALSVVEVLRRRRRIDQDLLAPSSTARARAATAQRCAWPRWGRTSPMIRTQLRTTPNFRRP